MVHRQGPLLSPPSGSRRSLYLRKLWGMLFSCVSWAFVGWHHLPSFSSSCVCPCPWRERAEGEFLPADRCLERMGLAPVVPLASFYPHEGGDCTEEAEDVALTVELTEWGCGGRPIAKRCRISYTQLCMALKSYQTCLLPLC